VRCGCKPGIAGSIESPRLYVHEGLPEGPEWKDVQRLLESITGKSPAAMRTKAILGPITSHGKRVEGERAEDGSVIAMKPGNADRAKGPCCL
jgi:site-specific recombinase XerC